MVEILPFRTLLLLAYMPDLYCSSKHTLLIEILNAEKDMKDKEWIAMDNAGPDRMGMEGVNRLR